MGAELIEGKKIAIFGATSKLASVTARKALAGGFEVVAFVRNAEKAALLRKRGAEIVTGDITCQMDVRRALKGRQVDSTINFAANFDQSADPSRSRPVNVEGERNVLAATVKYGIPRHIFISSIATLMEGPNAYKDTKLEAEQLVKASQVPEWLILRFANVLGTSDPNDLWNNPFITKTIFGKRIGFSKIPFKKDAPFPFLGVETATDAVLISLTAKPNQTITILDGFDKLNEYLQAMIELKKIDYPIIMPFSLMLGMVSAGNKLARMVGGTFPLSEGAVKMIGNMPDLESATMRRGLGIKPKNFWEVIQKHPENT